VAGEGGGGEGCQEAGGQDRKGAAGGNKGPTACAARGLFCWKQPGGLWASGEMRAEGNLAQGVHHQHPV
jgi:hypothetical protein